MIQRFLLLALLLTQVAAPPIGVAQTPAEPKTRAAAEAPEPPEAQIPDAPEVPEDPAVQLDVDSGIRIHIGRGLETDSEFIQIGTAVHVRTNQIAPEVVVVNASALIDGEVETDVVVVGGKAVINGHVHGDVVGICSGVVLGPGAVVDGDAVSMIGTVKLGPNARVGGDAVGLGGGVEKDDSATVEGDVVNGNWNGLIRLGAAGWPEWLTKSFTELVLKARPLSLEVRWVWAVAALFFLLHLLVILLAPRANRVVVRTVSDRGATAFLMGLVALPLGCLAALVLLPTVIGILAIPFLMAGIFCLGIAGKSGLLQHLGATLTTRFKDEGLIQESISMVRELTEPFEPGKARKTPAVTDLVVGTALVGVLYLIPFVGLILWMALTVWALGAGILAVLEGFRSESRGSGRTRPGPSPEPPPVPAPRTPASAVPVAPLSSGFTMPIPATQQPSPDSPPPSVEAPADPMNPSAPALPLTAAVTPDSVEAPAAAVPTEPNTPQQSQPEVPEALRLPRIALKERLLATLIDWVGVGFLVNLTGWVLPPFVPMIAYFVGFWMWKQTTLGGIILRIRVVRLDGRKIDFPTALVRSLGAFFGAAALGLGYFWAAWDEERQGWHDKLAGTVVVRVPKVQALV